MRRELEGREEIKKSSTSRHKKRSLSLSLSPSQAVSSIRRGLMSPRRRALHNALIPSLILCASGQSIGKVLGVPCVCTMCYILMILSYQTSLVKQRSSRKTKTRLSWCCGRDICWAGLDMMSKNRFRILKNECF